MHLCVIIPALNEAATIARVVEHIQKVELPPTIKTCTIVVVDDGSSDDTVQIATAAGATVVSHERNYGVGRAFRTGLDESLALGADCIVNIDADGQFNPDDIPRILEPLLDGSADCATASRFREPSLIPEMPPVKLWGNHQMSRMISLMVGKRYYDVSCGFRAYTRETALRLNLWGDFTYTQESFLDLTAKGMRIVEVPAKVRGVREFGESRVASNIWNYAKRSAAIIFHAYRDYWPLPFFSVIAALFGAPGIALLAFLLSHYVSVGTFSPHIWAGFVGGSLLAMSAVSLLVGILASILQRIRLNQEEILYHLKEERYRARR